jgi:hypothetical protein
MLRNLGGPYGWYKGFEEEKDLLPMPGITSQPLGSPTLEQSMYELSYSCLLTRIDGRTMLKTIFEK